MNMTGRQTRAFWLGVHSVFTFDRVSLLRNVGNATLRSTTELRRIRPFANDTEALHADSENVGRDFQRAIQNYERTRNQ